MELRNFFKKNNSKNSAQNDRDFKKKNNNFLKVFGCLALATFMGTTALFAVAPFSTSGASASTLTEPPAQTSTSNGLITPQEDDPVLFKTESGLEIKWGNAFRGVQGGGNEESFTTLTSGNLINFPYFTTSDGSTTYTWVVIGHNLSSFDDIKYNPLSYWQTNKAYSDTYMDFFNNTYENVTPAGAAIKDNNLLNAYVARKFGISILSSVKQNTTDIPSGCVLVLANECVATGVYNQTHTRYSYYTSVYYGSEDIATTMEGYYTNGSFGLSAIKNIIQNTSISTWGYSKSDGSGYMHDHVTISRHIFPLGSYQSTSYASNFSWSNYLTADQIKLSTNQWLRGGIKGNETSKVFYGTILDTSGTMAGNSITVKGTSGYRPAFCLKVVI